MELLDLTAADVSQFLELNNRAVPHVNGLTEAAALELFGQAFYAKQFRARGYLAGFLLVLAPGKAYESLNYRWFSARFDAFAYVDRIVIAEDHRGEGLGQKFYKDLVNVCQTNGIPRICCEVNLRPPNPGSSAFHQQQGFMSVGSQETEGGAKEVDLLVKELS